MLNCNEINELGGEYASGELSFRERISVWVHLLMCVHCRRYVEQLKLTLESIKFVSPLKDCSEDELMETMDMLINKKNSNK